jgi:hypothetical protein
VNGVAWKQNKEHKKDLYIALSRKRNTMANIYITEEVLEELDHALLEYNEKNAPTDRSGLIKAMIRKKK